MAAAATRDVPTHRAVLLVEVGFGAGAVRDMCVLFLLVVAVRAEFGPSTSGESGQGFGGHGPLGCGGWRLRCRARRCLQLEAAGMRVGRAGSRLLRWVSSRCRV